MKSYLFLKLEKTTPQMESLSCANSSSKCPPNIARTSSVNAANLGKNSRIAKIPRRSNCGSLESFAHAERRHTSLDFRPSHRD